MMPSIGTVPDALGATRCKVDDPPGTTARLLRRERRLPLPRPGVRGAPLRPRRAARHRVAADRRGGRGAPRLAPALDAAARPHAAPARRGAGADELLLLPGDRPAAAGDGGGDRVPA